MQNGNWFTDLLMIIVALVFATVLYLLPLIGLGICIRAVRDRRKARLYLSHFGFKNARIAWRSRREWTNAGWLRGYSICGIGDGGVVHAMRVIPLHRTALLVARSDEAPSEMAFFDADGSIRIHDLHAQSRPNCYPLFESVQLRRPRGVCVLGSIGVGVGSFLLIVGVSAVTIMWYSRLQPALGLSSVVRVIVPILFIGLILYAAIAGAMVAFGTFRKLRYRRIVRDAPFCPSCTYELVGNISGICPECGQPAPRFSDPADGYAAG